MDSEKRVIKSYLLVRDGKVTFATPEAAALLGVDAAGLVGQEAEPLLDGCHAAEMQLPGGETAAVLTPDAVTDELRQMNFDLEQALKAANAAIEAKTSFLSNMSHDIRTPMNAIIGMTNIACNHIDEKTRVKDCLNKIQTASQHLMSLINDVLDMSRIESGRVTLSEEQFSLADLVHDLSVLMRPLAAEKRQQLLMDVAGIEQENLMGDALYLRQVYLNIIGNAIKYTNEGGVIKVCFSQTPVDAPHQIMLDFSCLDNGIGMSPEFLKRIFLPFERAQNSTQSKTEGTGLGMSIAKSLVEQMGGTIHVESTPNAGSCFTVHIPVSVGTEDNHATAEGMSVLVVEPDREQAESVKKCLRQCGCSWEILRTGMEAVAWVSQAEMEGRMPDAVLLGGMGENETLNLAGHLRSQLGDKIPILLFSYQDWSEIEYAAQRAGISGFVPCPLFKGRLLKALTEGVEQRQDEEEPGCSGIRVLLAEDNALNREIAVELLEEIGAQVDTAEDGLQALEKFEASAEGTYDLLLMDIQMPVMDGCEATRRIRDLPREDAKSVCIAAMTANAFVEDIKKSRAAGMNEHLSKPVDLRRLEELLRTCQAREV